MIDSHTHLDACGARTAADVRAILDRAESVGVQAAVTIADDLDSARWVAAASGWDERLYGAVALHPTRVDALTGDARAELEDVAEEIDPRLAEVDEDVDTLGGLAFVLAGPPGALAGVALAVALALLRRRAG